MSEHPGRRQAPSPLVFSPETVLPPPVAQGQAKNGSGSHTVSMPFIKRHVTRRLKAAKQDCDKELQRITHAITTFFEERLLEVEREQYAERDPDVLRESFILQNTDLRAAFQDDASSDGGYEAELESGRHSRQPSLSSASPTSLRRQNTLPKERSSVGLASRRLSRSIHIPARSTRSGQSSRSTSRSRSPMPPSMHNSYSTETALGLSSMGGGPSTSPSRRSSRILIDDPIDPFMSTLHEIIAVCSDIQEMTISTFTANPRICGELVEKVQNIGHRWDEHPDWHGRNWYVQLLLAVAGLSRVVEWWQAEKQFWNFEEDDDEEEVEPLVFVFKPSDETAPTPTTTSINKPLSRHGLLPSEEQERLRLTRPPSTGRRSRDESQKDIGGSREATAEPERVAANKLLGIAESQRVLATERLRLQAEQAQSHNIVVELDLDGDRILWVNYAWSSVVGFDLFDIPERRLSHLLAPQDYCVFREATRKLERDPSHTSELRFRLQIESENVSDTSHGRWYREMEGKGMLMLDRADGQPTHTLWVFKPIGPLELDQALWTADEQDGLSDDRSQGFGHITEPITPFPFARPISTSAILCRICECQVPDWFFEKHNEMCNEVHRLDGEIEECNDSIVELRNTVHELYASLEKDAASVNLEYRGMQIFLPNSGTASPVQVFRPHLNARMQRTSMRKWHLRLLEQLEDVLSTAAEVSVPSLKEDESKEPIERQRLLSPTSERKVTQLRNWNKPTTEDAALAKLTQDVETIIRGKLDNVIRMQNTIRYYERVRQEWQEQVDAALTCIEDVVDEELEGEGEGDEHSSTTSEYAFGAETPAAEPTPMQSASPVPEPTPVQSGSPIPQIPLPSESSPSPFSNPLPLPSSIPLPNPSSPPVYKGENTASRLSSSTLSSPLALAVPIVASSSGPTESPADAVKAGSEPFKSASEPVKPASEPTTTRATPEPNRPEFADRVPRMRSATTTAGTAQSEPRLIVTPPLSPMIIPIDPTTTKAHRRHSTAFPLGGGVGPASPRIPSVVPLSRTTPSSIKDFDVIKPISKGAFGSVYLAKKKVTGDYYAIKVLKKADMIAKNQITNVKAERMILMKQAESPFVAKLYFTFQSKDNLYLVMEYLNGGDCAALIKSLGSLPEEWARAYIAEVVLGLEYLHQRGIIHRDLKPDNLLIDSRGHLKLTDFGLSRIGLLGRQTQDARIALDREMNKPRQTKYSPGSRPPSIDSAYLSSPLLSADILSGGSYFALRTSSAPHLPGPHPSGPPTDDMSESSGSENLSGLFLRRSKPNESPLQSFAAELTSDLRSHSTNSGGTPPGEKRFVGTPDYLAPESILGKHADDCVDWWALGVITYEFLYGIPPFHADTPEKVFENIISRRIEWHDDWVEYSPAARDFMDRLLTVDPSRRLGAHGAQEVKAHPWFTGIQWDKVMDCQAQFVPEVTDPESTDYFDPRGAIPQLFQDDEVLDTHGRGITESPAPDLTHSAAPPFPVTRDAITSPASDDFGSFSYKNVPVLKQANDDVIKKLRAEQMMPMSQAMTEQAFMHARKRSLSMRVKKPPTVNTQTDKVGSTNPPSPATSTSSMASSPSRGSNMPSTPGGSVTGHARRPSEYGAVERFKQQHMEGDGPRRLSMPSRLRTASTSSGEHGSYNSDPWPQSGQSYGYEMSTPASSIGSGANDLRRPPDPYDRAVTCLLAEDNPITAKILETLITRLGCRCVVVADGAEALSVAMGDIKFDCIFMDLQMPLVDGEAAARYIKSTNNRNTGTPIVAVSAYSGQDTHVASNLFAASLAKPVHKQDLLAAMRQLGFKTEGINTASATISTR